MIHFVIGTRAQLFKMAPVMLECKRRSLTWRWIYTGQHKETIQSTLKTFNLPPPNHIVVKWDTEAKSYGTMWRWLIKMLWSLTKSKKILKGYIGNKNIVLTHGDTFTTWFGGLYGKLTKTKVMHVESGLRSFNLFKPFPEEINRLITFRLADFYACPGNWALRNLAKYKGVKINTIANTQLDTIRYGIRFSKKTKIQLPKTKYVVASLHRYENIFKKDRFKTIVNLLEQISKTYPILMVLHPATRSQIDKFPDIKKRLIKNKKITLLPRQEYLPFIKLVKNSQFVITDGGGNQEELYYMNKPTLLFRDETERREGLGSTVVLSRLNIKVVKEFIKKYNQYRHKNNIIEDNKISPSRIIVKWLIDNGYGR